MHLIDTLRPALLLSLSGLFLLMVWRRFKRKAMQVELPVAAHAELLALQVEYHPERLRAEVSDVTLTLVGARPARAVRDLAALGSHVELLGEVPDLAPYIGRATVAVAPLRAGSGQALKVLEAMACGTPVVATSRAVEGLDALDGVHLRIADDAPTIAAAVAALLRDASERRRLADAARTLVETRYGWEVPVAALDALYTKIAGGSCGSSGS